MRDIFDEQLTLAGWFDETLRLAGWFDETLAPPVRNATLAATEDPDSAAFSVTTIAAALIGTLEDPDSAAFSASTVTPALLGLTESADDAAFTVATVAVVEVAATEDADSAAFVMFSGEEEPAPPSFLARIAHTPVEYAADDPTRRTNNQGPIWKYPRVDRVAWREDGPRRNRG